jgi:hypothetical protein
MAGWYAGFHGTSVAVFRGQVKYGTETKLPAITLRLLPVVEEGVQ